MNPKVVLTVIAFAMVTMSMLGARALIILPPTLLSTFLLLSLLRRSNIGASTFFHPVPFVSSVMLWSYAIAPFTAVALENYLFLAPKEIDWKVAMEVMAYLYMAAVICFWAGVRINYNSSPRQSKRLWKLNKRRTLIWSAAFLIVSAIAQMLVFQSFGGLMQYLTSWIDDTASFEGLGPMLMIAEAFPMVLLVAIVFLVPRERLAGKGWLLLAIFLIFVAVKLLFGGFRGSRSNTVWGIFWVAGICHFYYYRFRLIHAGISLIILLSFMSSYTLYKSFGRDAFSGNYSLADTQRFSGNATEGILLGDFSRAGVNAYITSEYFVRYDYELKWGQTYVKSFSKIVPPIEKSLDVFSKDAAGAELFYGDSVDPSRRDVHNSRIYGLYGEALLNFGPLIGVVVFFLAGLCVASVDNKCRSLVEGDVRKVLVPFFSLTALLVVLSDSDNVVFFVAKNGFLILLLVFLSSNKRAHTSLSY